MKSGNIFLHCIRQLFSIMAGFHKGKNPIILDVLRGMVAQRVHRLVGCNKHDQF